MRVELGQFVIWNRFMYFAVKGFCTLAALAVLIGNANTANAGHLFQISSISITPNDTTAVGPESAAVEASAAATKLGVGAHSATGPFPALDVELGEAVFFNAGTIGFLANERNIKAAEIDGNLGFTVAITFSSPNTIANVVTMSAVGTVGLLPNPTGTGSYSLKFSQFSGTAVDNGHTIAFTIDLFGNGGLNTPIVLTTPFASAQSLNGFITVTAVPEPTSIALLGLGAFGAVAGALRRRKIAK